MKKIIIITVLIIAANCNNNLSAQSFGFGTIAGDVGVGFGMYGIQSHSPGKRKGYYRTRICWLPAFS